MALTKILGLRCLVKQAPGFNRPCCKRFYIVSVIKILKKVIAGRPKAALLFWFFGDFRCGVPLFIVIPVIYQYRNR